MCKESISLGLIFRLNHVLFAIAKKGLPQLYVFRMCSAVLRTRGVSQLTYEGLLVIRWTLNRLGNSFRN